MAVLCKKGSQLMRDVREKRERERATKDRLSLAGTVIGNIMGVPTADASQGTDASGKRSDVQDDAFTAAANAGQEGGAEEEDEDEGGGGGRHKASLYGDAMAKPLVAASEFARTKTIAEQRAYLPIYGCRQELLNVIRDNSVIILVGETGSGKTTQVLPSA